MASTETIDADNDSAASDAGCTRCTGNSSMPWTDSASTTSQLPSAGFAASHRPTQSASVRSSLRKTRSITAASRSGKIVIDCAVDLTRLEINWASSGIDGAADEFRSAYG